jgi:hypothetical protein
METLPLPVNGCIIYSLMLGAQGLWAGRDFYRVTPAVTHGLGFLVSFEWPSPFSRLLRHARGCGGPILTRILTGGFKPQSQLAVRDWWSYVCCGFWWSWSLAGSARVTYVYRYGQKPVAIVVHVQQPPYELTGTVRSIKIVRRPCVSRTIFMLQSHFRRAPGKKMYFMESWNR